MSWVVFADFKKLSVYTSDVGQIQYDDAVASGEDSLIELVGKPAVDDTKSSAPSDAVRAAKLVRAHSYLAIAHYVPNTRILKKQQNSGSPATQGMITDEYFTPKELLGIAENYRSMAETAAKDYIVGEPGEPEFQSNYSSSVPIEFSW